MEFDILRASEVLSATPTTLRALLGNLSDDWTGPISNFGSAIADFGSSASRAEDSGEQIPNPKSETPNRQWEAFDVIGHLIHGEETDWIPRARIILEQGENTTFVPFDRFAQFEQSKGKSLAELLDEFTQLREDNVDRLLAWNLTDEQLDLEGMHPELGRVTLRQLLATWVVHDLNHVRQIATAMARKYDVEVGPWKEYLSILK